jgi:hypothetical protein
MFKTLLSFLSKMLLSEVGTLDLTSLAPALKTLYTKEKVENLVYGDNPLLAMIPKMESFYGDSKKQPLIYGNPQARSATFSTAQGQVSAASSKLKSFLITRVKDYGFARVDHETLKASENDQGAVLRAAQLEIDNAMHQLSMSLATALYRSGSGSIGQVANSSYSTTVLTLLNIEDVVNFEVGMTLVTSTADGGGSVKSGSLSVSGVDRICGNRHDEWKLVCRNRDDCAERLHLPSRRLRLEGERSPSLAALRRT